VKVEARGRHGSVVLGGVRFFFSGNASRCLVGEWCADTATWATMSRRMLSDGDRLKWVDHGRPQHSLTGQQSLHGLGLA
jgi:hypothetical protein